MLEVYKFSEMPPKHLYRTILVFEDILLNPQWVSSAIHVGWVNHKGQFNSTSVFEPNEIADWYWCYLPRVEAHDEDTDTF